MADSGAMTERLESEPRRPSAGKMRYLVEKWLHESEGWVLMARFHEDSEPERREAFCSALGGEVRVLDLTNDIELSRTVYE